MIEWFTRNSVAANLLMVSIIVAGLLALKTEVILESMPSSEARNISISVALRGASPEDAELGIATRIEDALKDLEGIDRMVSMSSEGGTNVNLELLDDYSPQEVLDQVKSRVDAINTFPQQAERPVIRLAQFTLPVMDVVIAGNFSEREIQNYAERVKDDLLNIEGITQAQVSGVRKYEISIEASQHTLRQWGLSLDDISAAINKNSLDASAGNLRAAGGDVLIRSKGQAYNLEDYSSIVVKTNKDGTVITLGDIAKVYDGFEEDFMSVLFNGQRAAFVKVSRVGDQNVLDIANKTKEYIARQQAYLPKGMSLSYWNDSSEMLKQRLGILKDNAIQGAFLVIIILTLFLRPSIAFWVFMGIPVSFLGAFIVMGWMGTTLNMMSAFGFIVVLGIVVDDAIVTGESVYSHMRTSESSLTAAIKGTQEVSVPVIFGVLTTIAAFAPIAYIQGMLGTFFGNIPKVVIPVLVFSLIESKFVLPAHLKHIKLRSKDSQESTFTKWQTRFAQRFEDGIIKYYKPVITRAIKFRYETLAIFVGSLFLVIALVMSGWTRWTFFPTIEADSATANLSMPVGTPFEVTQQHIDRMTQAVFELQDKYRDIETGKSPIVNILAMTGSTGGRGASSNSGQITFEMTPAETRIGGISTGKLVNEWRERVGEIPGAESVSYRSSLFRIGSPINIQFSGNDINALGEAGEKAKAWLSEYDGVYEIMDSFSDGKEELKINVTPQGSALGLTRSDIINQLGNAFQGARVQRIQRGRNDVSVIVRHTKEERSTFATLNQLMIRTNQGEVPLTEVATFSYGKGPSTIRRIDGSRVINITAETNESTVNSIALKSALTEFLDNMLLQYPGTKYSMQGQAREERRSFDSLESGLIIVFLAIYILLALPLRSYGQPLIVMSIIPFGLIGSILGHIITGYTLQIGSLLGMLALVGVMINDSLVLVDYINKKVHNGAKLEEAVAMSGIARFRPVFLTSMTTFLGLSPLILERSINAQFMIPMAISLAFGILFATVVTLIMVPCNVLILKDIKHALKAKRQTLINKHI